MAAWGRVGFAAWALAQLAWAAAGFSLDLSALSILGFTIGAVGAFVAAAAEREDRPLRWTLGVALMLLGVMPFFADVFLPLHGVDQYAVAGVSYMLGLAVLIVVGALSNRAAAPSLWVRIGAGAAALAGLIWVPSDGLGSAWFAGNALELVGAALVAAFPKA